MTTLGGTNSQRRQARWPWWSVLRLLTAALVVWVLASDHAGRLARLELASLPDADVDARARLLAASGHDDDALALLDWALTHEDDPARHAALLSTRREIESSSRGVLAVAARVCRGAVTGRGEDVAGLVGAVASDMLVFGDIRDLGIEAARLAIDGRADPVVVGLSAAGVATAVLPAMRAPARAARTELTAGEGAARLARFAATEGKGGRAMLLLAGPRSARLVAEGGESAAEVVRAVAVKGEAGIVWAEARAARLEHAATSAGRTAATGLDRLAVLLRPHWLVGVAKTVWKGSLPALLQKVIESLGRAAWWLLPAAVGWLLLEAWWLGRRALRAQFWGRAKPDKIQTNDPHTGEILVPGLAAAEP